MKIKCISQRQMVCLTPTTTPLVGQNLTIKLDSVNTISPLQKTVIWDQKGKRRKEVRKTKILHHSIRLNPSQGPLRCLPSSKVFLNYVIVSLQRAHSIAANQLILFYF